MGSIAAVTNDFFNSLLIFVNSGLFIDEIKHGLVSLFFAILFYKKTKSLKHSAFIVLMTYLIDMDHLFDYFTFHGPYFSFSSFLRFDYFRITKRAVVPFHAWEWVVALSIFAWQNKKHRLTLAMLATGILAHLAWDTITVGSVLFYSIIYRISQGFIVLT